MNMEEGGNAPMLRRSDGHLPLFPSMSSLLLRVVDDVIDVVSGVAELVGEDAMARSAREGGTGSEAVQHVPAGGRRVRLITCVRPRIPGPPPRNERRTGPRGQ